MDDRQSLSPFVILRVFAAAFVLLIGIGIMIKSGYYWDLILGAVFAACGLTFFALLWLYGRRSS
jgi:hypothetical protein